LDFLGMKIFCIGYNKTGTTSLYQSIKNLGFYTDENTLREGENLMNYAIKNDYNTILRWIEKNTKVELFKDVPFSIPNIWKILYKKYPNAKYILSERDSSDQWYKSIKNFHIKQFKELHNNPTWEDITKVKYAYHRDDKTGGFLYDYLTYTYGHNSLPYNKNNMISSYELHNNEVKHFFKNKNNFLCVNVSNDNDYFKLCDFLDKKPLRNKFLKLKITEDRLTW